MGVVLGAHGGRRGPAGRAVAIMVALALTVTTMIMGAGPARAEGTDPVEVPDANLKAAINAALVPITGPREPDQTITVAEAEQVRSIGSILVKGPIAELTGLEALTNLTTFQTIRPGNTFQSLEPLRGLTKLTSLTLQNGQLRDLSPLAEHTALTTLLLARNRISDLSPLAGLTKLTNLNLSFNQIRSLQGIPANPTMVTLGLSGNLITDASSLAGGDFDRDILATIDLSRNRLSDAAVLAPLGRGGSKLGGASSSSQGLILTENRITDLSAFDGWLRGPWSGSQNLYVGRYPAAGLDLTLKTANGSAPAVTPADAGSYDPATGRLTITDPAAASVTITPNWTVRFSNPPVDPGDPDGPKTAGTAQVGEELTLADRGSAFEGLTCDGYAYRWLRDSEEFSGAAHFIDDGFQSPLPMGSPGYGESSTYDGAYVVSGADLGHQLSLRVTCLGAGIESTSVPTPVVVAEEAERPAVQLLEGPTYRNSGGYLGPARSGVVGDPTNPTIRFSVGQLDDAQKLVDPASLTVALKAIRPTGEPWLTEEDVRLTGSGTNRTITVTPRSPGNATLDLTVTGTSGKITNLSIGYSASIKTTPTSRVLLSSSDASTAIPAGDGYLLVADDEQPTIRLHDPRKSGRELRRFSPGDGLVGELDFESAARKGDSIWWFGSHGNDKDGKNKAPRQQIFQTKLTGSGAGTKLTPTGVVYRRLRNDLVEWDQNNGNRFGLYEATREPMVPDAINGFNLEAAEFSPDGSQLYLGLRSPLVPATAEGKALIVPVTNLPDLTSGAATKARFGEPILLDLGGDSIRELRKNAAGEYLILSARAGFPGNGPGKPQTLWAWNGDPELAPRKLDTSVPGDLEPNHTDNAGAWEGIGELPERLAPGEQVRLIMDQGYVQLYGGGGAENKDDTNDYTNKARTDLFTLAGPAGTLAKASDPGSFGYQAPNTVGAARTVTVSNAGSNPLTVSRAYLEDDDQVSADDFLISANGCTGQTLAPTETCAIKIRFAPSRDDANSSARLAVISDARTSKLTVPLTGTTTEGALTPVRPTITGTVRVGSTATAVPGDWGDGVTLTYQWLRDNAAIDGATDKTYVPVVADADRDLTVKVIGSKSGHGTASAKSEPVVVGKGILAWSTPRITGPARVGNTLTAVPGTWTGGTAFAYQWLRNGTAITGATDATYRLVAGDDAAKISVKVTGSKSGYASSTKTSGTTTVAKGILQWSTPRFTGTARVGSTVTAVPGTWTGGTAFAYQWLRNGTAIAGATAATYQPVAADAGAQLSVKITGTKVGYTSVIKTSATATVGQGILGTATPRITGTARVGSTLTAVPGGWTSGTTFTYQWYAGGAVVPGGTGSILVPTAALKGKSITVKVTGSKPGYTSVARVSMSTGPVT